MSNVHKLINEAAMNCEGDQREYRGRGEIKSCLGIVHDNPARLMIDLMLNLVELVPSNQTAAEFLMDVSEEFEEIKTDSMGRSSIVYFPNIPYIEV